MRVFVLNQRAKHSKTNPTQDFFRHSIENCTRLDPLETTDRNTLLFYHRLAEAADEQRDTEEILKKQRKANTELENR